MISWTLEKRSIASLKDHPRNPRKLSKHDGEHLKKSIQKFGVIDKPVITPEGLIIGGHQRKNILKQLKLKEIDCWVPDRDLTDDEIDELNIRLNRNQGAWDYEMLANQWEFGDLLEWGFTAADMQLDSKEVVDSADEVDQQLDSIEMILDIPKASLQSFTTSINELLSNYPEITARCK